MSLEEKDTTSSLSEYLKKILPTTNFLAKELSSHHAQFKKITSGKDNMSSMRPSMTV